MEDEPQFDYTTDERRALYDNYVKRPRKVVGLAILGVFGITAAGAAVSIVSSGGESHNAHDVPEMSVDHSSTTHSLPNASSATTVIVTIPGIEIATTAPEIVETTTTLRNVDPVSAVMKEVQATVETTVVVPQADQAPETTVLPEIESSDTVVETTAEQPPELPTEITCDGPFIIPAGATIIKIIRFCAERGLIIDLPYDYPLIAGEVFDVNNIPLYTPISTSASEGGNTNADSSSSSSEDCPTGRPISFIRSATWTPYDFLNNLGFSDVRITQLIEAGFENYYGTNCADVGERMYMPDAAIIRKDYSWLFAS